jgi:NCS1 family nucleobase:cation symporter-1
LQVVTAIWPSYARLPNHLPASAGFTTKQMVSYVIYHCFQTPCLFIRPHKLKYLFRVKVVLLPPMIIATVIWLAVKAGGGDDFFHRPAQIHGAARAWQWLAGMTSVTGRLRHFLPQG